MRFVVATLIATFASLPGCAATLERLSLDDMILKSTAIVRGRVLSAQARFHGPMIYTHLRVQVLGRWKGAPAAEVEVISPGGRVGRLSQSFSGSPMLAPAGEYVLFLWTGKSGLTHVIGLSQGVLDLARDGKGQTIARRAATSEFMLDPQTGRPVNDSGVSLSLKDLDTHIRRTLADRGPAK
jgi:hypothetical protein